ncbi:MAG: divalent-cation tolerance protein CutA [Candidatus Woesearchaeota archaeon]
MTSELNDSNDDICVGYVTHPDKKHAQKIVDALLKERLIACAVYLSAESSYIWKGDITHDSECITLLKTRHDLWDTVKERIIKIHEYDTPCILQFSGKASEPYMQWLRNETQKAHTK